MDCVWGAYCSHLRCRYVLTGTEKAELEAHAKSHAQGLRPLMGKQEKTEFDVTAAARNAARRRARGGLGGPGGRARSGSYRDKARRRSWDPA